MDDKLSITEIQLSENNTRHKDITTIEGEKITNRINMSENVHKKERCLCCTLLGARGVLGLILIFAIIMNLQIFSNVFPQ